MTLYARSDIDLINVPVGSGGCGAPHLREVTHGARAKLFVLNCPGCENFARSNLSDLWSGSVAEIPETHDEQSEREDYEKRGANDIQTMMALALTRMTGGEVPDTVARMIDGSKLHIPSQVKVLCPPYGHANPPGMKFCGECAAPMHAGVPAMEMHEGVSAVKVPPLPDAPNRDLADLHPQKLRKMCREKGLDDSGTRPEMLARLAAAEQVAA